MGFPNKDVPPIIGIPNYKTIKELNLLLSANAVSAHFNHGNGAIVNLTLTVSNAVYDTLTGYEFTTLTNPGATVDIPADSTSP